MEVWKDIKGYEGLYQVSNKGRIKGMDRTVSCHSKFKKSWKGKIKVPYKNKNGYLLVRLHKKGGARAYSVHRLVAMAFIPNPKNYPQTNHISGVKTDNCVKNLEWCTMSYNHKHAYSIGLKKITEEHKRINREKNGKTILCVETGIIYPSIKYAASKIGVNASGISRALAGINKTSGGFRWKYYKPNKE